MGLVWWWAGDTCGSVGLWVDWDVGLDLEFGIWDNKGPFGITIFHKDHSCQKLKFRD